MSTKTSDTKPLLKYQTFPGANRFWLRGRLITGPDRRSFFIAILLILIPAILTGGMTWTWLFIFLPLYVTLPLLAIQMFLLTCDYVFMFITAFRDPGIIPRHASPISETDTPWYNGAEISLEASRKQPEDMKKIIVNGQKTRVKYCKTCNLYRPPRCIHCGVCDNCVDRFDHHCPWVGNCIGRRNYQSFFLFVWSLIITAFYELAICILHIIIVSVRASHDISSSKDRFIYILPRTIWSWIMIPYCLLAIGFVGFLGSLHCYLVVSNQTTNEKIKGLWSKRKNPYSRGFLFNWFLVVCGVQPTKYNGSYGKPGEPAVYYKEWNGDKDNKTKEEEQDLELGQAKKKNKKQNKKKNKNKKKKSNNDVDDVANIIEGKPAGGGGGGGEEDSEEFADRHTREDQLINSTDIATNVTDTEKSRDRNTNSSNKKDKRKGHSHSKRKDKGKEIENADVIV